jgi:WS/DGAT/MGAT family acyltransferase
MAPQLARRMSAQDASFLYFETPDAPLHIGSLGIFEGTIDIKRLRASMAARMHLIPRYRQRAVFPPFAAGHPTWEDDPEFSLERHIHQVQLEAPGTFEQLRRLTCELFEPIMRRDRPLWDMYIIHGVDGGKNSAMLSRVHHCMVDGVSGIELLLAVLDLVPNPDPTPPPAEEWRPSPLPNPLQAWSDAVFDTMDRNVQAFNEFQQALLDPRAQFRQMTAFAQALEVTLPTALRPRLAAPWHKRVTRKRDVAWRKLNFQEVRGIRSKLSGTVNDVVLTVLGGAFGKYLAGKGMKTQDATLRFMCPVNVRAEAEYGDLGNRVSMMFPEVPIGIASPADRLVAVCAEMDRLKSANQAGAVARTVQLTERVPAAMYAMAGMGGVPSGGGNLICTNVPGPLIPLYSVGHRMLAIQPMLPLAGDLGSSVAIMSYNQHLYISVMADPTIIPDVEKVGEYIDDEFALLRYVAQVPSSDLPDIGAPTSGNGHAPRATSTPIAKKPAAPEPATGSTPVPSTTPASQ